METIIGGTDWLTDEDRPEKDENEDGEENNEDGKAAQCPMIQPTIDPIGQNDQEKRHATHQVVLKLGAANHPPREVGS